MIGLLSTSAECSLGAMSFNERNFQMQVNVDTAEPLPSVCNDLVSALQSAQLLEEGGDSQVQRQLAEACDATLQFGMRVPLANLVKVGAALFSDSQFDYRGDKDDFYKGYLGVQLALLGIASAIAIGSQPQTGNIEFRRNQQAMIGRLANTHAISGQTVHLTKLENDGTMYNGVEHIQHIRNVLRNNDDATKPYAVVTRNLSVVTSVIDDSTMEIRGVAADVDYLLDHSFLYPTVVPPEPVIFVINSTNPISFGTRISNFNRTIFQNLGIPLSE